MPYYEMDIPRVCTALADWLACLLYLRYLPPRFGGWKRIAIYTASLFVLAGYLVFTDGYDGWQFNLLYAGSILIMILFLWLAAKTDANQLVFFCARAVVSAGFAASLMWQLYVFFAPKKTFLQTLPVLCVYVIACYGAIFAVQYLLQQRNQSMSTIDFSITPRMAGSAAITAISVYILSSISYTGLDTPFTANGRMEIYSARSIVYFGGIALLEAYQSQLCDLFAQREADALRNMLFLQYENYKMRQESIDLINRKYHDLKHQIAVLRTESPSERNEVLDRMEKEIKIYEAHNDTGNKVLDTVLTGKMMTCNAQNIQLTCVADGEALNFMDAMDLSNLFGNALDNAIESASKLADAQKRLIHLRVSRQKGFVAICVENCYEGVLKFKDGLPLTTKPDKGYHGFGLKSIQATAQKYGGSVTVSTHDDWFELRVLIPMAQHNN